MQTGPHGVQRRVSRVCTVVLGAVALIGVLPVVPAHGRQSPEMTLRGSCDSSGDAWSATLTIVNGTDSDAIVVEDVGVSGATDDAFAPIVTGAEIAGGDQLQGVAVGLPIGLEQIEVAYSLRSPAFGLFEGFLFARVSRRSAGRSRNPPRRASSSSPPFWSPFRPSRSCRRPD